MGSWRRVASTLPFLAVVGVVLARGATASGGEGATPARPTEPAQRRIAREMLAAEAEDRLRAVRSFPGDPWSQGDAFHAMEMRRAHRLARRHGVSVGHVLAAVDRALREAWYPELNPSTDVAPCKPRPFYD